VGTLSGTLALLLSLAFINHTPTWALAYFALLGVAVRQTHHARSFHDRDIKRGDSAEIGEAIHLDFRPSVDVIVPCYNEDPTHLGQCLESLAKQDYDGELHFWIVDDGSRNRDLLQRRVYEKYARRERWELKLLPFNVGKRLAQDKAVGLGNGKLVVTIDSDTVLSPDALSKIVAPFQDPNVGMAGGRVSPLNATATWLTRLITTRYQILFDVERAAQSRFDRMLCCSGAFSAYRRAAMQAVWPKYVEQRFLFAKCTWGEDLHLTLQILKHEYRSQYVPQARAQTIVPETLRGYARQQLRWNRSLYRELRWMLPVLMRRPVFLSLDVTARLLLPFLFPLALVLAASAGPNTRQLLVNGRWVAGMMLAQLALGLWQTWRLPMRQPLREQVRFHLLYGLLHLFVLIPVRLYALFTLRNNRWGTRRIKAARPALPVMETSLSGGEAATTLP